jgi:hypothetical protein
MQICAAEVVRDLERETSTSCTACKECVVEGGRVFLRACTREFSPAFQRDGRLSLVVMPSQVKHQCLMGISAFETLLGASIYTACDLLDLLQDLRVARA